MRFAFIHNLQFFAFARCHSRIVDDNVGVNAEEVNAIRYLTFYSTWIEDNTGRFLTLRYELTDGPWTLTIAGDDTKFALSHLCDKLGKRVEVRRH